MMTTQAPESARREPFAWREIWLSLQADSIRISSLVRIIAFPKPPIRSMSGPSTCLPFKQQFDGLELLPAAAVPWLALQDGAVHPVGSDQLLNLVDLPASG